MLEQRVALTYFDRYHWSFFCYSRSNRGEWSRGGRGEGSDRAKTEQGRECSGKNRGRVQIDSRPEKREQ